MRESDAEMIARAVVDLLIRDARFGALLRPAPGADGVERLSPKEIADVLGCAEITVRRAIRKGKIAVTALPGAGDEKPRYAADRDAVERFRLRVPPRPPM